MTSVVKVPRRSAAIASIARSHWRSLSTLPVSWVPCRIDVAVPTSVLYPTARRGCAELDAETDGDRRAVGLSSWRSPATLGANQRGFGGAVARLLRRERLHDARSVAKANAPRLLRI